jgi:hypothetical protein
MEMITVAAPPPRPKAVLVTSGGNGAVLIPRRPVLISRWPVLISRGTGVNMARIPASPARSLILSILTGPGRCGRRIAESAESCEGNEQSRSQNGKEEYAARDTTR